MTGLSESQNSLKIGLAV